MAHQRIMNLEPAKIKGKDRLQLPILGDARGRVRNQGPNQVGHQQQDDGDENPHQPEGKGVKYMGIEYEQDETGYQEMRKQFHNHLLESQRSIGPVTLELNAIMDNFEEAQTRVEGNDKVELVRS